MTLLEKFHQWLITEPFNSKQRPTLREAQCVFIADEFAIGFAEWFWVNKDKFYKGERDYYLEFKELLEIYKKEVGL
jgi:hypothetical protein